MHGSNQLAMAFPSTSVDAPMLTSCSQDADWPATLTALLACFMAWPARLSYTWPTFAPLQEGLLRGWWGWSILAPARQHLALLLQVRLTAQPPHLRAWGHIVSTPHFDMYTSVLYLEAVHYVVCAPCPFRSISAWILGVCTASEMTYPTEPSQNCKCLGWMYVTLFRSHTFYVDFSDCETLLMDVVLWFDLQCTSVWRFESSYGTSLLAFSVILWCLPDCELSTWFCYIVSKIYKF